MLLLFSIIITIFFFFFFFQAEDGIRFLTVTGVQTCALPISWHGHRPPANPAISPVLLRSGNRCAHRTCTRRGCPCSTPPLPDSPLRGCATGPLSSDRCTSTRPA